MRELPAAVLVSVAVHAAALVWITAGDPEAPILAAAGPGALRPAPPEPAPPEPPPPEPAPAEPPPIEVVFLDERAARAFSTTVPLPPARATDVLASSAHDAPHEGAARARDPAAPAGAERPGRTPLMTMRRPELRGELSGVFLEDFLARSKPAEPVPDLPGARIDAEIAELRARLRNPNSRTTDADRIRLVELHDQRKQVELQPQRDGAYKADSPGFTAKIDRDGKAHLEDKPSVRFQSPLVLLMDVTDMMMRTVGIDPYASEKLRLLDRTRDQRAAIGHEHRREQLAQSAQHMRRNIERLWASTSDLSARKQGLFELWDECAEAGSAELLAGGTDARRVVADFIKVELTGASAYTAGELARLNARRRSKAAFAPYDPDVHREREAVGRTMGP